MKKIKVIIYREVKCPKCGYSWTFKPRKRAFAKFVQCPQCFTQIKIIE